MQDCAKSETGDTTGPQPEKGGSIPTLALQDFRVEVCGHGEAKAFIERWHYSHRIPTGKNICRKLITPLGETYAVIVYGIGVNPYQASFLGVDRVLEIKRMARSEPNLGFPLSRFISISQKQVLGEFPSDAIVAFADPEQGHEGTVYAASGFLRHGETNAEYHLVDSSGNVRHRRFAYRYSRRNGVSINEARLALGLSRRKTLPKIRWVKMLKCA